MHTWWLCHEFLCTGGRATEYALPGRAWERASSYRDVYNDKGSAWECIPGGSATSFYSQMAEPPSMHYQAEPGNEIGKIILNIN